ncbi:MAG: GldG family protein [Anaerolineae bacterium]|nr:GldG family protein [Anaerolineae bacterium]
MSTASNKRRPQREVRQIEATRKPLTLDRLTVARIASAVGSISLIVAVIAFLLAQDITTVVIVATVLAVIGIGAWTVLAPGDLRALLTGRQTVYGTNSIFLSILFIGIVAIVSNLLAGTGIAVDLTTSRYYTLKSDVSPVVRDLQRPIIITAFYSSRLLDQQSQDRPFLRMFEDAAPDKVRVDYLDPNEQPVLARQLGLDGDFGIFVSYLGADGKPDVNATEKMTGNYANQRWIAEAILRLQARGSYTVAFTTGSGEISGAATGENNISSVRDLMTTYGITVIDLDLSLQEIPQGLTALLLIGPQRDFSQLAVDKITQYMANGGKMLVMAEPAFISAYQFMTPPESPMALYLSETWGIKPDRSIVFDLESNSQNSAVYVLPNKYADDPMLNKDSSGISKVQPLFSIVQSFTLEPRDNIAQTILYASSERSFARASQDAARNPTDVVQRPTDLPGPRALMIKAEDIRNNAKLIVVGDADWIRNDEIQQFDGAILWTGTFDYLTNFVSKITVNPIAEQLPLNVKDADLNAVAFITLILMPGLVLLAGIAVWVDRFRRG